MNWLPIIITFIYLNYLFMFSRVKYFKGNSCYDVWITQFYTIIQITLYSQVVGTDFLFLFSSSIFVKV